MLKLDEVIATLKESENISNEGHALVIEEYKDYDNPQANMVKNFKEEDLYLTTIEKVIKS
ncbi:hypothetical protein CR513_29515, partial [Mucuna pruriens]